MKKKFFEIFEIFKILFLTFFFLIIILISIKTFYSKDLQKIRQNQDFKIIFLATSNDLKFFESAFIVKISFVEKKIAIFPINSKTRIANKNEKPIYLQDIYKKICLSTKNNKNKSLIFAEFIEFLNEFYDLKDKNKFEYYVHFSLDKINFFNKKIFKSDNKKLDYNEIINYNESDEIVSKKYENAEIFLKTLTIYNIFKFLNLRFKFFSNEYDLKNTEQKASKLKNFCEITKKNISKILEKCNVKNFSILEFKNFSLGDINDSNMKIFYLVAILLEYKNLFDNFKVIFVANNNILYGDEKFYIKNFFDYNFSANKNDGKIENLSPVIEVLNATNERGLSLKIARRLRENNFDAQVLGNYSQTRERSIIIDRKNNWNYANLAQSFLKKGIVFSNPDKNSFVDVSIILGKDMLE